MDENDSPDAFFDAAVEEALVPYRAVLPPDVFAAMREDLELFLATHPAAVRTRARIVAPAVQQSGPVARDGAEVDAGDESRGSRRGSR